jgi:tripartite-type tricarboxylate transporter receptor subunit TctC
MDTTLVRALARCLAATSLGRSALFAALTFAALPPTAIAQDRYPTRPITMIFPYPAGGFDAMARAFAEALAREVGQPIVFVNRDGAAGRVAFEQFAKVAPDGYTLAFSPAAPLTSVPHLQSSVAYRFDDFEHVCQIFENTFTIAVPASSRFTTVQQLVAEARANPGRINYGHPGIGSGPHLALEGLSRELNVRFQSIPYRGGGQMLSALAAAQVDVASPGVASIAPRKDTRALALFSSRRNPLLPDVPAITEAGLPAIASDAQGLYAPKGTPRAIVAALEQACRVATESEAFNTFAKRLFQTTEFLPGAALHARNAEDSRAKERLIRELGLRAD